MTFLLTLVASLAVALLAIVALLFLFTWFTARRIEAALPPTGRFVEVPGARLHVVERGPRDGQGPSILLVHGLSGQLANFGYGMIEPLARDFHVVAVDRPGAGYSTRAPGARADLDTQADVLAALIDQLGLDRPLVVGHSLGGAIALALAIRHPSRVGGLALVAPLTHPPTSLPPVFGALANQRAGLRRFVAWTLALPMSIVRGRKVMDIVFGPDPVPRDFATRGGGLLALRPAHFIAASQDLGGALGLAQFVSRYGEVRAPVGILFGSEDRILDPKENGTAFVGKVPGATLTLVPGGHMLPVTAVRTTVEFVRKAALRLRESSSVAA